MYPKRPRSNEEIEREIPAKKKQQLEDVPSTPDCHPDPTCFGEVVQVILSDGTKRETHDIHKGLLCFYSRYFRGALSKQFKEEQEKRVELEDVDVGIFAIFKGWLYTRTIRGRDGLTKIKDMGIEDLVDAWVLGDRLIVPLFKNKVIDQIPNARPSSNTPVVHNIYANTTDQSGLRRKYIIMRLCSVIKKEVKLRDVARQEDWPTDAIWDLAGLLQITTTDSAWLEAWPAILNNTCDWHVHPEGVKCRKKETRATQTTE